MVWRLLVAAQIGNVNKKLIRQHSWNENRKRVLGNAKDTWPTFHPARVANSDLCHVKSLLSMIRVTRPLTFYLTEKGSRHLLNSPGHGARESGGTETDKINSSP